MDGIEATAEIRKSEEEYYRKLPIIALTANATSEAKEMFLKSQMNDFVAKTIQMSEITECLRKWLPEELVETCELPDDLKKKCQELSVFLVDVAMEDMMELTMDMIKAIDDGF